MRKRPVEESKCSLRRAEDSCGDPGIAHFADSAARDAEEKSRCSRPLEAERRRRIMTRYKRVPHYPTGTGKQNRSEYTVTVLIPQFPGNFPAACTLVTTYLGWA